MNCPNCNNRILSENINIQTDIAKCTSCGEVFKISSNVNELEPNGFDMNNPPKGCWSKKEMDILVIGATTRNAIAFFLVPFMLVWSGGSIGGIYGSQIINGEFSPMMSLFGIPFLIGSIIFWSIALMAINGKVELTLDNTGGKIFTGIGKLGFTRKFTWEEIQRVSEDKATWRYPGASSGMILLEGKKRISFGTGISNDRRYFLYKSIQVILGKVKQKRSIIP